MSLQPKHLPAHSYMMISCLTAYTSINRFDVLCLLESFFYFSTLSDNSHLEIPGYAIWKYLAIHLILEEVAFVSDIGAYFP